MVGMQEMWRCACLHSDTGVGLQMAWLQVGVFLTRRYGGFHGGARSIRRGPAPAAYGRASFFITFVFCSPCFQIFGPSRQTAMVFQSRKMTVCTQAWPVTQAAPCNSLQNS